MKPVEATWEGRGVRRGTLSHLSSWNLLHTIGCSCVLGLTDSSLIFRVLRLVAEALALHSPPGAPAPCACTPLKLVLLNILHLCLFMPDPRLLEVCSSRTNVQMQLS